MKDTYTYRGQWWLPDTPDATRSGTLTIDRGAATLDVEGDFGHEILEKTETETVYAGFAAPQERILGVSTDGKSITLLGCHAAHGQHTMPGIPTTIYRARFALIGPFGAHFEAGEPIEFSRVDIRVSNLETWIGASPFSAESGPPGADPWLTLRVSLPDNEEFQLPNGLTAQIRVELDTRGLGAMATSVGLEYFAWIGLSFPEPHDLDRTLEAVGQLRNFLSLAIGRPLTLLAIDAYNDKKVGGFTGTPVPIKLLYEVSHNPDVADRAVFPWEMLFSFEEARDRFPAVLSSWIDHHDLLQPVFALYFGTLYHPSLYLELRFLAYAQAIETYDRLRRPGAKERDASEHKELVSEIVAAAPDAEKKWLKGKLAFSNEPVLADRLRHVLGVCPALSERVAADAGLEPFVKAVKDSRNYYTHYTPALKGKAATGAALYLLAIQLRTVLEAAMLLELGFPCDVVEQLLARAGRFNELDNIRQQV